MVEEHCKLDMIRKFIMSCIPDHPETCDAFDEYVLKKISKYIGILKVYHVNNELALVNRKELSYNGFHKLATPMRCWLPPIMTQCIYSFSPIGYFSYFVAYHGLNQKQLISSVLFDDGEHYIFSQFFLQKNIFHHKFFVSKETNKIYRFTNRRVKDYGGSLYMSRRDDGELVDTYWDKTYLNRLNKIIIVILSKIKGKQYLLNYFNSVFI